MDTKIQIVAVDPANIGLFLLESSYKNTNQVGDKGGKEESID